MRKLLLCTFYLILCTPSFSQELAGTWQGRIEFFGKDIRAVFHFKQEEDKTFSGTTDSPDQGAKGIVIDEIEVKGDSLLFDISANNSTYSGKYFPDSAAFIGMLKQSGFKIPLKLIKGDADDLLYKRSQKLTRPFPYSEEEVIIINKKEGDTLAGTFTKPFGKGKFSAVILISGSGPEDRDETVFAHKPFLVLSDYLTRKGFAVLRCDDRGTGKSTGNYAACTPDNFSNDVEAQLDFLLSRKDVDKKRIGLIGHSEGGIIAPMVAAKRNDVAFIVLLAGVAVDFFENLLVQDSLVATSDGYSGESLQKYLAQQKHYFSIIQTAKDSAAAADSLYLILSEKKVSDKIINSSIKQLCSSWMRWYIGYDPRVNLKKLHCAVLAINGEKDIQVPAVLNISAMEQTLTASGNKNFKTEILPGLNHLFQQCKKCSVQEYVLIEETINTSALSAIGDWMEKYLQVKRIK